MSVFNMPLALTKIIKTSLILFLTKKAELALKRDLFRQNSEIKWKVSWQELFS